MPRSVLITTSVLVVVAAVAGFWLGKRQMEFGTTDITTATTGIINAIAARHVKEHGGAATDCIGWAGEGASVFQIKCGDIIYHVDRFGDVTQAAEDEL
ncbi:MAG: hypothetical protein AAFV87_08690 [Pseudomonadota bacterium]